ncbi:hypothetical protein NDN08_001929 [Rhodosorus marinus]|uniref:Uncharacterized protein n=1 Tax=Rhodosorus marinus TaxID=101924 RepID=A0AAV8UWJ2_9RHOD|nr:hypothetical protein NDN08_001929 [Rhodosorus marinus]
MTTVHAKPLSRAYFRAAHDGVEVLKCGRCRHACMWSETLIYDSRMQVYCTRDCYWSSRLDGSKSNGTKSGSGSTTEEEVHSWINEASQQRRLWDRRKRRNSLRKRRKQLQNPDSVEFDMEPMFD